MSAETFDDHVVHIGLHVSFDLVFEDLVHYPMICSFGIYQAERHDYVGVDGSVSDERRLGDVSRMHAYLVVPGECVEEGHELVPCRGVNQLVNAREG